MLSIPNERWAQILDKDRFSVPMTKITYFDFKAGEELYSLEEHNSLTYKEGLASLNKLSPKNINNNKKKKEKRNQNNNNNKWTQRQKQ